MPKISVIVPVYEAEAYLDRCLVSLVNQTLKDIEIVLVDDASPDLSGEICDAWAARNDLGGVRIVVVHRTTNGGHSAARNSGLNVASGKYIGFVDSDDCVFSGMYEKLVSVAEKKDCDVAQCGIQIVAEDLQEKLLMPDPCKLECVDLASFPQLIHNQTKFVFDKIYRREMLVRGAIRFHEDVRFHEDHFFLAEVDVRLRGYAVVDYIGYRYSIRRKGASTTSFDERLLDCPKVYWGIRNAMIALGLWERVEEEVLRNAFESYRLRVNDFSTYKNVSLQKRIIAGWMEFFNSTNVDWRKQFLSEIGSRGEKLRFMLLTVRPFVLLWIYLPQCIKERVEQIGAWVRKACRR